MVQSEVFSHKLSDYIDMVIIRNTCICMLRANNDKNVNIIHTLSDQTSALSVRIVFLRVQNACGATRAVSQYEKYTIFAPRLLYVFSLALYNSLMSISLINHI